MNSNSAATKAGYPEIEPLCIGDIAGNADGAFRLIGDRFVSEDMTPSAGIGTRVSCRQPGGCVTVSILHIGRVATGGAPR
jgi:hypothetical protein